MNNIIRPISLKNYTLMEIAGTLDRETYYFIENDDDSYINSITDELKEVQNKISYLGIN